MRRNEYTLAAGKLPGVVHPDLGTTASSDGPMALLQWKLETPSPMAPG